MFQEQSNRRNMFLDLVKHMFSGWQPPEKKTFLDVVKHMFLGSKHPEKHVSDLVKHMVLGSNQPDQYVFWLREVLNVVQEADKTLNAPVTERIRRDTERRGRRGLSQEASGPAPIRFHVDYGDFSALQDSQILVLKVSDVCS